MAKPSVQDALDAVEMTYADINEIVNEMLDPIFEPINELVEEVNANVNGYTTEELRNYIMRLQLRAYEISEIKEKSLLKATLAESLQKEKLAKSFNELDGNNAVKTNLALIASANETIVAALYEAVSNLLKTKVDQLHRLVDALKSVLMSRMQEAKLTMNAIE